MSAESGMAPHFVVGLGTRRNPIFYLDRKNESAKNANEREEEHEAIQLLGAPPG